MNEKIPPHKQPVEDRLQVVFPSASELMKRKQAIRAVIKHNGEELVIMEQGSWFSERHLQLRLPGYRKYRFDRPDDVSGLEPLKALFNGMVLGRLPQRRMVWRAGAGIVAHVSENSMSEEELSARVRLDGEDYRVTNIKTGYGERAGRLYGPQSLMATIEGAEKALIYSPAQYHLTPEMPTRIDLLAIAVHTSFWMERALAANKPAGA